MSTALKLSQINLDLVFGAHKFKNVPQQAEKYNYSESESTSSSNSASINLDIFFFFTLYFHSSKYVCAYFFLFFILESIPTGYTSVIHTFPWYFIPSKVCINYTIKFLYFSFYVIFHYKQVCYKILCLTFFKILFQISLYLTNALSFSITRDI